MDIYLDNRNIIGRMNSVESFKTLKAFILEHKWKYIFGVIWLIIIDTVQLLVPKILARATDDIAANLVAREDLIKYALLIILTGFIIFLGRYFWRIYIIGTSRRLEYYLRKKLFNKLLTLSSNYYNRQKTGDLMAHATNDINAIRMALGPGTIMLVDAIFLIILSLYMMVSIAGLRLTTILVVTFPLIMIIVNVFGKIIYKRFKKVQEAFSNLSDISQESLSGIRVIKSFVQEDLVSDRFYDVNKDNYDKNLNLVKIHGLFNPLLQFLASISFLILIFYGGRQVISNNISLGDFVALNLYLGTLIWPTRALGMVINVIQRGTASMDRLNIIFNEESEIKEISNPIILDKAAGQIEFRNVSFKYPNTEKYALKNISFKLDKGKTLALIGPTGSGKTTIVNLLLRLYDINQGSILLDNYNIKYLSLNSLREAIGYVPQDNFLFSESISENISFAYDQEVPMENIIKASKAAQVYDNILEFPNQFDTILGERGVTLSGGQKQRTSIARAIIKEAPILILDDSLSAVDTETEEKILNNLSCLLADTSSIVISHRVSTIKDADEILYLKDGEILERGSHTDLIELGGEYKGLYDKQLLEKKINQ